ncbi:SacI homology domain-containing protein [Aspergillus granulosus]|uniref:SacI homology domain-containing protein n=1 Tax=Aspergillus granulosus TaxID=176169 RepID=A0ABR4HUP8_9EURO
MESFDDVARPTDALEERSMASVGRSSRTASLGDTGSLQSIPPEPINAIPTTSFTASSSNKTAEDQTDGTSSGNLDDEGPLRSPFSPIPYNPPPAPPSIGEDVGEEDEEPQVATSFERDSQPTSARKQRQVYLDTGGEDGINRMHKFSLYETATWFYMVGMDLSDTRFRILKIDRTSESDDLNITEDDIVYTKREMSQLLDAIDDGNKSSGGLKLKCSAWALLGFIRFTGAYYMLLVTKRSQVAMLGGHYVYKIDGTELISLTTSSGSPRFKPDKNPEEARYIAILNNLDLTRAFYFSYSYDITNTLQQNITRDRKLHQDGLPRQSLRDYNTMFIWNHHLLTPAITNLRNPYQWCLPIIHGYVNQSKMVVYDRLVYITIIARRSRFFAGARFLKRGANDLGYVANDVETEQIVAEMTTTSFHSAGPDLYSNPLCTSYVQHRGSIPLYWTQESSGVSPKPGIELNLVDPFYSAAALHFDNLFARYGAPIYILNLIKSRERTPRESKLLKEYTNAIQYLNQFLPTDKKLIYKPWDMSRAAKSRDQDVIGTLEDIAGEIIPKTGFFKNGRDAESGLRVQNGIARTNCIDCLDRTNAAQFVIGKRALGYQLHALGIIEGTTVEYDTDIINMFTEMWHDHGDNIAIQYGGSHLVNTMATYRKINQWSSHSRDMVESFKRYYNNSFLDAQRQEAYNLFLGNYIFTQGQPMLWDLSTDYYLHHADPRFWANKAKPNYIQWYTPENLKERELPVPPACPKESISRYDDYWFEYYRPLAASNLKNMFPYKMNSTIQYRPPSHDNLNLSPFVPRITTTAQEPITRDQRPQRSVTIKEPDPIPSPATPELHQPSTLEKPAGIMKPSTLLSLGGGSAPRSATSSHPSIDSSTLLTPNKAQIAQLTLGHLVSDSLNPSVTAAEAEEYERYINHPLKVPLVVTSEDELTATALIRENESNHDLLEYVNKCNVEEYTLGANAEENLADYVEFLNVSEEGLTVVAEDYEKKRYKRYRQWLRGKSLFKQRVDM